MKKIEEIEEEYESYTTDKPYVSNLMEFFAYIEIGLDQLVEEQDAAVKERKSLKRDMFMLKLIDFITMTPIEEDTDINFLVADIKAVNEIIELSNYQAGYFAEIAERVTEENFKELLRLVDFSSMYYSKNLDYLDYLRDVYEFQRKGINMFKSGIEDNRKSFDEFMQKKLKEFAKVQVKPVEKVKK